MIKSSVIDENLEIDGRARGHESRHVAPGAGSNNGGFVAFNGVHVCCSWCCWVSIFAHVLLSFSQLPTTKEWHLRNLGYQRKMKQGFLDWRGRIMEDQRSVSRGVYIYIYGRGEAGEEYKLILLFLKNKVHVIKGTPLRKESETWQQLWHVSDSESVGTTGNLKCAV